MPNIGWPVPLPWRRQGDGIPPWSNGHKIALKAAWNISCHVKNQKRVVTNIKQQKRQINVDITPVDTRIIPKPTKNNAHPVCHSVYLFSLTVVVWFLVKYTWHHVLLGVSEMFPVCAFMSLTAGFWNSRNWGNYCGLSLICLSGY